MPRLAPLRAEDAQWLLGGTVIYLAGPRVRAQRGPGEGPEVGGNACSCEGARFTAAKRPHGGPRNLAQGGVRTSRIRRSMCRCNLVQCHQLRYSVHANLENQLQNLIANGKQLWLILPEVTAIGLRLNHASREGSALGRPLSNTRITCPWVGDKLGKLSTIPHRPSMLEC